MRLQALCRLCVRCSLVLATTWLQIGWPAPARAQTAPAEAPTNEILNPLRRGFGPRRPNYEFAPGVTIPAGPTKLDWDSVLENFVEPVWLVDGKFGIFIHWGLYSVAAHHNEWYPKHMYGNGGIIKWHEKHFGPQDQFGYKDFIPLFTAKEFNPDEWAALFKAAGARYVMLTAEHHDRFALWDSKLTRWDAGEMGPKRDLVGELGAAVRAEGMKYGVSNHRMFGYDFMLPAKGLKTDLYDPEFADFYGPPKEGLADQEFCNEWLARTLELVDKYQPDFMWFDWDGTGGENPVKLQFAAYYFNRAAEWGKQVAISEKGGTFPRGAGVPSHEKGGRMPRNITREVWLVDDVISDRSWGYTDAMKYRKPAGIIHELIDAVSKNGTMMLNISPRGDGSIPQEQQEILREIGAWLAMNGEAIYGTRPAARMGEGNVRFTTKEGALYAILTAWPGPETEIPLAGVAPEPARKVADVRLLGHDGALEFSQNDAGLNVKLPAEQPCRHAFALKITWEKLP